MNAQHVVDQADAQNAQIVEGAKLGMAFKTDSGRIIAESLIEAVSNHVDTMLWENLSDENVLKVLYQIRGILEVTQSMGDAIRSAVSAVSRNAVAGRLRTTIPQGDRS